ncbi:hypothetical protein ABPG77_004384 [Micractinium sp. CCAP 211/92]
MSVVVSSLRLQPWTVTAVLAATVLVLLGERLHVFQRQNLELEQHLHSSADGQCSEHGGSAPDGAADAAWRRVADGQQFGPNERSFYTHWIEKDLARWKDTGITLQMVNHAHAMARLCNPGAIRLQIVNGTLWVTHAGPPATGYYPASGGPGALSSAGRVPYFLLSLMESLALFPGQIPDVDLVYQPVPGHPALICQHGDFPCIRVEGTTHAGKKPTPPWAATAGGLTARQLQAMSAPPILGYNGHRGFVDIPWPDYNFWGHEQGGLVDEQGRWLYGWDAQLDRYLAAMANLSLPQRWPELVWRGRATTNPRDAVRVRFKACPAYLQERNQSADIINVGGDHGLPGVRRLDFCRWRYISYMESMAWSTSFKHKLSCGSVVMLPVMEYFEFYSRALQPGMHYIELSHKPGEMCEDIARNVVSMNAWLDALQERQAARERYSNAFDSDLTPVEVARNAQQFMHEHVRMRDARLYVRDLLIAYAAMQRFKPSAVQYTGAKLLQECQIPIKAEAFYIAARYPWLPEWKQGLGAAPKASPAQSDKP